MNEFVVQGLVNLAWAFASANQTDEKLFRAVARKTEWATEFHSQELANMA